jgi:hypothetical protein
MDVPGRRRNDPGLIWTDTGCGITFSADIFTTVAASAEATAAARTINWRTLLFI